MSSVYVYRRREVLFLTLIGRSARHVVSLFALTSFASNVMNVI
jgi:hypothetical protein